MNQSAPTPEDRLIHIISEAQFAMSLLVGKTVFDLKSDRLSFQALCRTLIIIGEAANHVPIWMKSEMSNLSWSRMVGMRNLLVHQYWMIDPVILFGTINNQLPALVSTIETWRNKSKIS
jgi:uncharacterized protein with HEPN domain